MADEWESMTRTEQGYAWWKEDPKTVADARVQVRGLIAQQRLREALIDSWAVACVDWLAKRLTRG